MRNQFFRMSLIVLVVYSNLISCTSTKTLPEIPSVGIPTNKLNKQIKIFAPAEWNTFRIGDLISLSVENMGGDPIAFKPDYGARLYMVMNGQWIEVPNRMKYSEGYEMLLPTNGDAFKSGGTDVDPIFPENNKPITLRVILIGNIVKDEQITDERVAGYIDVELKP